MSLKTKAILVGLGCGVVWAALTLFLRSQFGALEASQWNAVASMAFLGMIVAVVLFQRRGRD